MGISEQIRNQLIESFKTEQQEHIQKINQGLLALEKNPDESQQESIIKEIFREAHSLKGSARAVGMTVVESIGHAMEDILLQVKEKHRKLTPELFDLLYQTLDAVEEMMRHAEKGNTTPPSKILILLSTLEESAALVPELGNSQLVVPPAVEKSPENKQAEEPLSPLSPPVGEGRRRTEPVPTQPQPQPQSANASVMGADETIRVSVSKLDTLMAQSSELLGTKIRIEQRLAEVREMQIFATQWYKEWLSLRSHYSRLMRDGNINHVNNKDIQALINFTTQSQERIRIFNTQSNVLYRQLSNDTMRLSLVIDELQEEIKRVRMLPLSTITATFERMVRDLARQQGKQVRLTILGSETELDKRVLEQIKDPLIHILRNAVDHGLEMPEVRQKNNKPIEGHIVLEASQQGHNVVIRISDNGMGLDLEAIRAAAIRNGLLSQAEAQKLNLDETAMLVFISGLSTSPIITDISGRGVGMDVVRQNVADLQGILNLNFQAGQGTILTITLPLTLTSSRGLLVRVNKYVYALPFSTVERMLEIKRSDIGNVEGHEVITYQERPVELVWLEDLLELPMSRRNGDKLTAVIVAVAEKRLAMVVDKLEGEQEIVMKNLGKQLLKVGGIGGATVLGSGEVVLVLHTADLVKLAARVQTRFSKDDQTKRANELAEFAQKVILVVDDSITTRTLEKNILEAAGYVVKLATNGEEALSVLMSDGLPNLVVTDINMPFLDGFELTNRIKKEPRYTNLPVILVTSLDSPSDKARGIDVGADAYIVKSSFDQGNLLETIEQLVN